jgi:hypothetical protein
MNHMIHIAAISQLRLDTDGRAYYRRKRAEGKKPLEAIRCLKRRISDAIYRQLVDDAQAAADQTNEAGPGGHRGASHQSSAVDPPPHIDTSDQPLPRPATSTLQPTRRARKTTAAKPPTTVARQQRGAEVTRVALVVASAANTRSCRCADVTSPTSQWLLGRGRSVESRFVLLPGWWVLAAASPAAELSPGPQSTAAVPVVAASP